MKKVTSLIAVMIVLPFLLSLDPSVYNSNYYAKYKSPEGVLFLSYSTEWNETKLKGLYNELLKNQHGEELNLLQEVRVRSGPLPRSPYTTGRFNVLTNTIDLFHGDMYTKPSSYQQTLTHEYGHLFTYHYIPSFHLPFSKWAELRGLKNEPIHWDAFWNYSQTFHDWFPEEIIADDYVLLYGSTRKVNIADVYSNEAFYLKTQHHNQKLPNVLENQPLQHYLENETGLKIDPNRLIQTPKLTGIRKDSLTFSVTKRKNIAYRLNLTIYEKKNDKVHELGYHEILNITKNANGQINYPIESILHDTNDGYIKANMDVLDLNTSLGLQTKSVYLKVHQNELTGMSTYNENALKK